MCANLPSRFKTTAVLIAMLALGGWRPAVSAGENERRFIVPEGFVVEKLAGPPIVKYPMFACFDERGRLFVAEAAGKNLRAAELLKNLPNFIRVLDRRDSGGHFTHSAIFADKMVFPMGVLPYRGKVYSASPPHLWWLEDSDGDGRADRREPLVSRFGFTGNAASIHGPYLGRDGWIYWTDGRHGHEIRRGDGKWLKGQAARIFRCRPDGSDVEVVCGGGMDDPVGIAFTPEGEPLATVDILHNRPSRNDGIIFAVEGGVYPWHSVLREFPRTGGLLPAVIDLGWVAPAGLCRYRSGAFGDDYRNNYFSAQFNRHRIQRHQIERKGAFFTGKTEDFLICSDPNFHPTDVLEDADGSLLVIDTGGWFRIGCPTSQTAKPQFMGGIYRVRRKGMPAVADPLGRRIDWRRISHDAVAAYLDDPRFFVRDRAIEELALRGKQAVPAVAKVLQSGSEQGRRNAVWTLARMDCREAHDLLIAALADASESVRIAAARVVGLERLSRAEERLIARLKDTSLAVRRQAATALGRLRAKKAVPVLLAGLEQCKDRFLEHAIIYALIQIGDPQGTAAGLRHRSSTVRRAAIIVLDQIAPARLDKASVAAALASPDRRLQETALDVMGRRKGWAGDVVAFVEQSLRKKTLSQSRRVALQGLLTTLADKGPIRTLIGRLLLAEDVAPPIKRFLLGVIGEASTKTCPKEWRQAISRSLRERMLVAQAVAAIRSQRWHEFDAEIRRLAEDEKLPLPVRLSAAAHVAPAMKAIPDHLFRLLLESAQSAPSPLSRMQAAEAIGRSSLNGRQLLQLAEAIPSLSPLELPAVLAAFRRSKSEQVGERLIAQLEKSGKWREVSGQLLAEIVKDYPASVRRQAQPLIARLSPNLQDAAERISRWERRLNGGDARIGRSVFFGSKALCHACHTVRGKGGKIGPDLSTIGAMRSRRDLLESILYPSAALVRGYEPVTVATRDGRVLTGLITQETADAIFLTQTDQSKVRIGRDEIEAVTPSRTSIMPQGLERQISVQEFRDLLAYLQSLK